MKQGSAFLTDILNLEAGSRDRLWCAGPPVSARAVGGAVMFKVPFREPPPDPATRAAGARRPPRYFTLRVEAWDGTIVRVSVAFAGRRLSERSPMLARHVSLQPERLNVRRTRTGWEVRDAAGRVRFAVETSAIRVQPWRDGLVPEDVGTLRAEVRPDGRTIVPFMAWDRFFTAKVDSFPLGFVARDGRPTQTFFALHAAPGEKFAGTGERFTQMNLAGRTLALKNADALGVNNRQAYKNVPFYISSRPYGLFVHTSHHLRLSLADVSTRAALGAIDEPVLDLFFFGGGSVERVLFHYRRLTGFPPAPPRWSYGTWMSRMTYFSEREVRGVARRLRADGFPCDVLHLDTGWFAKDWVCEWRFSPERFPDPARFLRDLRRDGFRVSLWQTPNIGRGNRLLAEARRLRYLAPIRPARGAPRSDFSAQDFAAQIDFSNPAAVRWYQGLLRNLFRLGAAAIKTDFGEEVDPRGDFAGMPAAQLHNLYGLLYQRAAFEETQRATGTGLIWARTGWAGCQRYPVHWGGDSACTWDGMAGSLRGGLHLGLSGFGFWSHDVPGFHGIPDFMMSRPADDLYVRWTQFGVFTSHFRYHGTSPREPYEYPRVAELVRRWWRLRYALIPYLEQQGRRVSRTGYPVLRALIFHHGDDPTCWGIDDQFYCGDAFLVAPVMNAAGVRDVYLPSGEWVDLWTGSRQAGPRWLRQVRMPLARLPVYVRAGARVPVYPHRVACTDEMRPGRVVQLVFDRTYRGLARSRLGALTELA